MKTTHWMIIGWIIHWNRLIIIHRVSMFILSQRAFWPFFLSLSIKTLLWQFSQLTFSMSILTLTTELSTFSFFKSNTQSSFPEIRKPSELILSMGIIASWSFSTESFFMLRAYFGFFKCLFFWHRLVSWFQLMIVTLIFLFSFIFVIVSIWRIWPVLIYSFHFFSSFFSAPWSRSWFFRLWFLIRSLSRRWSLLFFWFLLFCFRNIGIERICCLCLSRFRLRIFFIGRTIWFLFVRIILILFRGFRHLIFSSNWNYYWALINFEY